MKMMLNLFLTAQIALNSSRNYRTESQNILSWGGPVRIIDSNSWPCTEANPTTGFLIFPRPGESRNGIQLQEHPVILTCVKLPELPQTRKTSDKPVAGVWGQQEGVTGCTLHFGRLQLPSSALLPVRNDSSGASSQLLS